LPHAADGEGPDRNHDLAAATVLNHTKKEPAAARRKEERGGGKGGAPPPLSLPAPHAALGANSGGGAAGEGREEGCAG
jgi:hypothetical protein